MDETKTTTTEISRASFAYLRLVLSRFRSPCLDAKERRAVSGREGTRLQSTLVDSA
jgi:hypothetical protein